jgi:putative transposase
MEWIQRLTSLGVKISMDGKGRWIDNVFIERLWRGVKYEDIYINCYLTVLALELGMDRWFGTYNDWLPHSSLGMLTPSAYYAASRKEWSEQKGA